MSAGHIQETSERTYIVAKDGEIKTFTNFREAILAADEDGYFSYTPYEKKTTNTIVVPRN